MGEKYICWSLILLPVPAKGMSTRHGESCCGIQEAMAFLRRRQRRTASHHTLCPPAPVWHGGSRDSLPYWLDYSSLQGARRPVIKDMWPSKSIDEVQQTLRELGLRQTTYFPVFESFFVLHSLQGWKLSLQLIPALVWGTDIPCWAQLWDKIFMTAIHCWSGEMDEPWGWVQVAMRKTQDRDSLRSQKSMQIHCKGSSKNTEKSNVV